MIEKITFSCKIEIALYSKVEHFKYMALKKLSYDVFAELCLHTCKQDNSLSLSLSIYIYIYAYIYIMDKDRNRYRMNS